MQPSAVASAPVRVHQSRKEEGSEADKSYGLILMTLLSFQLMHLPSHRVQLKAAASRDSLLKPELDDQFG